MLLNMVRSLDVLSFHLKNSLFQYKKYTFVLYFIEL